MLPHFSGRELKKRKVNKADISTIHKTWVRLMMQMNELYSIKKYNIFPSLGHAARFIDISKLPSNAGVIDRVDPRIIDIALSCERRTCDRYSLSQADARYRACFENFANRNEGLDEYRATLKSAGLGRAGGHSLDELKDAVGLGQLVAIHVMTEQTIEILDETLSTLRSAMDIITVLVNKKYKGKVC